MSYCIFVMLLITIQVSDETHTLVSLSHTY